MPSTKGIARIVTVLEYLALRLNPAAARPFPPPVVEGAVCLVAHDLVGSEHTPPILSGRPQAEDALEIMVVTAVELRIEAVVQGVDSGNGVVGKDRCVEVRR